MSPGPEHNAGVCSLACLALALCVWSHTNTWTTHNERGEYYSRKKRVAEDLMYNQLGRRRRVWGRLVCRENGWCRRREWSREWRKERRGKKGNSKNQRNQFNWGASIRKRKLSSKRSKGKKERRKKGYEDWIKRDQKEIKRKIIQESGNDKYSGRMPESLCITSISLSHIHPASSTPCTQAPWQCPT